VAEAWALDSSDSKEFEMLHYLMMHAR